MFEVVDATQELKVLLKEATLVQRISSPDCSDQLRLAEMIDSCFNLLISSWRKLLDVQLWTHENCHQHLSTNACNYPLYIAVTLANSEMKESVQLQFCNPQNTFALVQMQLWDIELSKTSQSNNNEKSLGSEWSCWHKASDWYTAHECVTNRNRWIIPSTASVCFGEELID